MTNDSHERFPLCAFECSDLEACFLLCCKQSDFGKREMFLNASPVGIIMSTS